ncbi:triose-phosphate isomerase family protein [Propionicimonas sp.]|uniref:triose-phosphate isomerase family protein n=1 Tax=Propionicimonas sp. TaxID=1955623 RepID=UPI0039E64851
MSLKLYFDTAATVEYSRALAAGVAARPWAVRGSVLTGVLPSFLGIPRVQPILAASGVLVGAQDLCQEDRGAFTGEVSGTDLRSAGCSLVEVGHAERRSIYDESDELVAAKLRAALRNHLVPLLCVGEREQSAPDAAAVECARQVLDATAGGTGEEVWIAYEPVWAIGAPQPAPVEYVREVCTRLREALSDRLPQLAILYGGSAGPGLLGRLWPTVDGLFLGRFAHDPEAFLAVADEAATLEGRRTR